MGELQVVQTTIDPRSPSYLATQALTQTALTQLHRALDLARESGGERAVTRHHARGGLLARERLELLVDRDSPLLELNPTAGWGAGGPVGAGVVTGIGVVADRICVLAATDTPVADGVLDLDAARKLRRAVRISSQNRLPLVLLLEVGREPRDDPPPVELRRQLGQLGEELAALAADQLPTVGVCFGGHHPPPWAPDLADWLAQLVTLSPVTRPGRAAFLADDERQAIRAARECVERALRPPAAEAAAVPTVTGPAYDPAELLGVPVQEPREILTRVLDGSEFDEVDPAGGPACAGWGRLHGHRVAVLADAGGGGGLAAPETALRLLQDAETNGAVALVALHGGATLPESTLAPAVAASLVPLLLLRLAGEPAPVVTAQARFRFAWPTAGSALEHAAQLTDDAVIDPLDTRPVLGICLGAIRAGRT
ncbi:acetyl-CoA carboxylase carboxyltransferase subunit [Natronosporangium hydrolyticum]|uniref:Acetyl-CoA carboxylase carboxyltransferase subunit n=1 Tax=Natronosporangium hydrolyticum TaxID=2811111 RepID=A0A895YGL8_9ACTN|nr:carboxyl transferase domain-containing protein [Natronosporangium hydrolyticum]QSB14543.1 acetyl-CoA carboxylase carboxyltransferase subunit [Natronosporangium hydrolyticum]